MTKSSRSLVGTPLKLRIKADPPKVCTLCRSGGERHASDQEVVGFGGRNAKGPDPPKANALWRGGGADGFASRQRPVAESDRVGPEH